MKIIWIPLAAAAAIGIHACGGSRKTTATVSEQILSKKFTPIVDGNAKEWSGEFSYDNGTKTIYSIVNDEERLFILIKAGDRLQQAKILKGGMEIWLDDKARKNKTVGLKFPLAGGGNGQMANRNEDNSAGASQRLQTRLQLTSMELVGFKEGLNGIKSLHPGFPVRPAINWDENNTLVYELSILFSALPEEFQPSLSNFSVGILIKGIKMPEGGRPAGLPAGRGGGMGRRPRTGWSGGAQRPNQNEIESMRKDGVFWVKYAVCK